MDQMDNRAMAIRAVCLGMAIVCIIVVLGIVVSSPVAPIEDAVGAIDIYNEEVQQVNITGRDIVVDSPTGMYYAWTEHGDVYTVENYSVFRSLVPGWHTVNAQVPINRDKMPRIVGVVYP
ncbi:MAG: hypothetical protein WC110_06485 [Bacteroidales bacterium]|jgi:hypothetical protein